MKGTHLLFLLLAVVIPFCLYKITFKNFFYNVVTPPIVVLNDFVKYKKAELSEITSRELQNIDDILIEGMDHFVGVACLKGNDFETVKEGLYQQLMSVPEIVRNEVIKSALIKETSVLNVVQNSSKPLQKDGTANAYLGWWNTQFTEPSNYQTCVLVSGISFKTAEILEGFIEEKKTEKVGNQPCNCGLFYCETCPILLEKVYNTPMYKKSVISFKEHNMLHQYMVREATQMAGEFLKSSIQNPQLGDSTEWKRIDNWKIKIKD